MNKDSSSQKDARVWEQEKAFSDGKVYSEDGGTEGDDNWAGGKVRS